jgi:hypothetical protein
MIVWQGDEIAQLARGEARLHAAEQQLQRLHSWQSMRQVSRHGTLMHGPPP